MIRHLDLAVNISDLVFSNRHRHFTYPFRGAFLVVVFLLQTAIGTRRAVIGKIVKLTAYQLLRWRFFPAAEWNFLIRSVLHQKFTTAAIAFGSWANAHSHLLWFLVFAHYYTPSDEATICSISAQRRLMPSRTSFLR